MAQILYPDADISSGSWTPSAGSTLWDVLNDQDDNDYAYEQNTNTTFEVGIDSGTDPESSSNHIVYWSDFGAWLGRGSAPTVTMYLIQGSTTIASQGYLTVSNTFTQRSYTLTSGEADSITDYTNLRIRFTGSGGSLHSTRVGRARLEIPDAVASGWGEKIQGVANVNIGKVEAVTKANISKIIGV